MATSTLHSRTRRSRWHLLLRVFLALFLLAVVGITAGFAWFYRAAHASLPQLDGSIPVAGLHASVTVIRDAHGVPHITAATLEDLFFAQGYITAQDRLWQLDLARRHAAGEMAEILPASSSPPPTPATAGMHFTWVDYDKRQRILRLRDVAEHVAQQLPARDRSFFEAYSKGVNTYIGQHGSSLPFEFRMLGYTPRPWKVADSVLIGISMSQLLNPQFEAEYWREKLGAAVSPDLIADLYPVNSWHDHPPASQANDGAGTLSTPSGPDSGRQESFRKPVFPPTRSSSELECESCSPGSNDWVVSGAHTTTGKALLSDDMHLPHSLPGIWYEVQLHSGDFNVEGFSLPGVPFIIVGHNQRIAWGFTNLNPDVQDLFVENFNSAGEYQTPSGWQKPEVLHEVIHVRKAADVTFNVVSTRHGPIVSDFFPGETRRLALQWLIYDERAIGIPLFDLDSAQNWEQFRRALSTFSTPSQNVVYADVDGHIGYQPMGFVPVRASGDGTTPAAGADGKHDWTGYLPFDKLPNLYDPPSGIIATANGRITPDNYPYLLATQWWPPYRSERIYRVLESKPKFTPDDMLALQTDITSEYDRFFADRFVYAIDHTPKAAERVRQAADIMRGFDGRMLADSAAPTIVVGARRSLWKKLLQNKLGDAWEHYEWSNAAVAIENIVQNQPQRWLPSAYKNFDELLTDAVADSLSNAPADLKSWKYGTAYPVEINHPLYGAIPFFNRWTGPGVQPQSGGNYTVKQVGRRFGPSERMTVDFSNLDGSHFNIVIGESGQIFSPYYMDQWDAWYNNKTFSLAFSDQGVQNTRSHELRLEPAQ
jgi:penicillin amidase